MRGRYFWGAGIAFGAFGNLWCHLTGRPTLSSELRDVDERLVSASLGALLGWFLVHLYGKSSETP